MEIHLGVQLAISWKLVTSQRRTSKQRVTSMCRTRNMGTWYWSADILIVSCQLTTTWMCNTTLQAPTLAKTCDISHWFPCDADEQTVGRTVTWLPKFLGWIDNQIFLAMELRSRFASGAPLITVLISRDHNYKELERFILLYHFNHNRYHNHYHHHNI